MHGTKSKRSQQLVHKLWSFGWEENLYLVGRFYNPSTSQPVFASTNDLFDHSMNVFSLYRELHLRTHGCLWVRPQSGNYVRLYFGRIRASLSQEFASPRLAVSLFFVAETLDSDTHGSSHALVQALRSGLRGVDAAC